MQLSFVIIDDTELDHFIARKMFRNANRKFRLKSFTDATQALEQIIACDIDKDARVIMIFLDIYMPMMDGFEFIEEFEKLDKAIQDKYYVAALTSSRDIFDISRINSYRSFKAVIAKPMTAEELSSLIKKVTIEYGIQL